MSKKNKKVANATKQNVNNDAVKTETAAKATPEKKKEEAKIETKVEEKPKTATKTEKKKEEAAPVVTKPNPGDLMNGLSQPQTSNGTSADTMTRLGCLLQERYVNGNNGGKAYPKPFLVAMNDAIDGLAIGALVKLHEEGKAQGGTLQIVFPEAKLPALLSAAKEIGIDFNNAKMLPGKTDSGETQLSLDFNDAKIPDNISKAAKAEIANASEIIETDITKMKGVEELHKAINYILADNTKSVSIRMVEAVDLCKSYHLHKANNDSKKKLDIENKNINEWLEEIAAISNTSLLITSLASGMYANLCTTKSPFASFLLLRKNLMDKETKAPVWADESIAIAVRTLTELAAKDRIKMSIDVNGNPKEGAITDLKDDVNLPRLTAFEESVIDGVINSDLRKEDDGLKKIYGLMLANYFDGTTSKEATADIVPAMKERLGYIGNLFRPFDAKWNNYPSTEAGISPKKITVETTVKVTTTKKK